MRIRTPETPYRSKLLLKRENSSSLSIGLLEIDDQINAQIITL
ncbi:MAG: hypothetical protein WA148_03020 [Actinomycetota bacterium]